MTLSELIKLKLSIDELAHCELGRKDYQEFLRQVVQLEKNVANEKFSFSLELARGIARDRIESLTTELIMHFNQMTENIDHYIAQKAKQYQNKKYAQTSFEDDKANRVLPLSQKNKEVLLSKIRLLSDWHYPGLEISPHDGTFTQQLVGSDPLYIADQFPEYLDLVNSMFSEQYKTRLRKYHIDMQNNPYLGALPQQQFGVVFSWNFFNYLPLQEMTQFLQEVYGLLRPGGTFLFSFNDAGMVNGAKHAEWGGMAYTPKYDVVKAAEKLGYQINASFGEDCGWHNISWMEIQKPGTLTTVKAHQTLGIVKP